SKKRKSFARSLKKRSRLHVRQKHFRAMTQKLRQFTFAARRHAFSTPETRRSRTNRAVFAERKANRKLSFRNARPALPRYSVCSMNWARVTKTATADTRASFGSDAVRATMPNWQLSNSSITLGNWQQKD